MSPPTILTEQEKEACVVLSTLFLDTDQDLLRNYMSLSLYEIEPEIPIPTLERMLHYDVFPILFPNCLAPAGEWAGFDNEWLIEWVEAGRSRSFFNPWRWIRAVICFFAWLIVGTFIIWPNWCPVREDVKRRREGTFQMRAWEDEEDELGRDDASSDGEEGLGVWAWVRKWMWRRALAAAERDKEE